VSKVLTLLPHAAACLATPRRAIQNQFAMYKKGVAVEIQFSPDRLNDAAGDPYWIDLSLNEARDLLEALQKRLDANEASAHSPLIVSLDETPETPGAAKAASAPEAPAAPGVASASEAPEVHHAAHAPEFRQWVCIICGWIYDEAAGLPEEGIPAGTRWADVPADWRCPLCDVGKEDFALVEF
jgi:rubredoxin